ncbi:RNAse III [Alkalispirochaeta americana]|uniref:Ribonuclease 3 n=1 Tax=Alkalispirochaeta americana TaxID=159291 RepID=A0A1N6X4U6_9SPIO|nr:ribonuclease III [Alkalispirochaeta americana]SIQ97271.1 RNAse III [Alkalispirochaeta americana]
MAFLRAGSVGGNVPDGPRKKDLHLFENHAGLKFRNLELLNQAFSHRSYANERDDTIRNNERLEFLGDSVLGLVVAEYLYIKLGDRPEGDLARIKSFVVSEDSLAEIARKIRVDTFILIGKGEEFSGGRSKKAILADALEAIIGAYFLDSGFKAARRFVISHLEPQIESVLADRHRKDYKTLLQELAQKMYKTYPRYSVERKTGPDHDKTFWVQVDVAGNTYGPGMGKNKKEAEQGAAKCAYAVLAEEPEDSSSQVSHKE